MASPKHDIWWYRERMEAHMESRGAHVHNALSCLLRSVKEKYGVYVADKLVEEYSLTILYGIHKLGLKGMMKEFKKEKEDEA